MTTASVPPSSLPGPRALRRRLQRFALLAIGALLVLYVLGVAAGYGWLRYGRKIEEVRVVDVALLQVRSVRQAIGRQHYVTARAELAAKNYQAAYLSFASALHQDPENVPGRIEAAEFYRAIGASNQCLAVLEEGLVRQPDDLRLIEATFDHLLAAGRAGYALELLRQRAARGGGTGHALPLVAYEFRATLAAKGPAAAREFFLKHPELHNHQPVAPVLARVVWAMGEAPKAIGLLALHVDRPEAVYDDFALLAAWQEGTGLTKDAVRTAQLACQRFPQSAAARTLLIEMHVAAAPEKGPSGTDVASYLRDFRDQPEAIPLLASTAGRRGWVSLTRMLYDLASLTQADLGFLALSHADALARNSRFEEFVQVLNQLENQAADNGSPAFMLHLRTRQVIGAAALKNADNVREYSRRLATIVRNEPDRMEAFRQFFLKNGLDEAVKEFSPRATPGKPADGSKRQVGT